MAEKGRKLGQVKGRKRMMLQTFDKILGIFLLNIFLTFRNIYK